MHSQQGDDAAHDVEISGRQGPHESVAHHNAAAVAVFAIARKLAILVYRMLRYGQDYVDIGEQAYEAQFQHRRLASLTAAAQSLGYTLIEKKVAIG